MTATMNNWYNIMVVWINKQDPPTFLLFTFLLTVFYVLLLWAIVQYFRITGKANLGMVKLLEGDEPEKETWKNFPKFPN